jgi:hypothetical protein
VPEYKARELPACITGDAHDRDLRRHRRRIMRLAG